MIPDTRRAVLILRKRGENQRVMIFESHIDAWETFKTMGDGGWQGEMIAPEHYPEGQRPPEAVSEYQERLL